MLFFITESLRLTLEPALASELIFTLSLTDSPDLISIVSIIIFFVKGIYLRCAKTYLIAGKLYNINTNKQGN